MTSEPDRLAMERQRTASLVERLELGTERLRVAVRQHTGRLEAAAAATRAGENEDSLDRLIAELDRSVDQALRDQGRRVSLAGDMLTAMADDPPGPAAIRAQAEDLRVTAGALDNAAQALELRQDAVARLDRR